MRASPPGLIESQGGWQAHLDLSFARRDGQTVLIRNQHRGPLQVQKALYPEGQETCHIGGRVLFVSKLAVSSLQRGIDMGL